MPLGIPLSWPAGQSGYKCTSINELFTNSGDNKVICQDIPFTNPLVKGPVRMTAQSTTDLLASKLSLDPGIFFSSLKKAVQAPLGGQGLMHDLAREGDVLSAEVILETGGEIDHPDCEGRRPLHDAAAHGRLDMVRFLVAHGAQIDAVTRPFGHSALYLAVEGGHRDVVRFLLQTGAVAGMPDHVTGQSPLHVAAAQGDLCMAGILIAAGINVAAEDRQGRTARDFAIRNGHRSLEKVLLKVMAHHAAYGF